MKGVEIKTLQGSIRTIDVKEIAQLHSLLSQHEEILALNPEPILPRGIKDENLLESATSRQFTSLGDFYKYNNVFSNCSSLIFGIICNHPFHNGNKRTALLAMILHLYRNGYVIDPFLRHDQLYEFLRRIASHTLAIYHDEKQYKGFFQTILKSRKNIKMGSEDELKFIEYWIKRNSVVRESNTKPIKWSELVRILKSFDLSIVENDSDQKVIISRKERRFFWTSKFERAYPYKGIFCYPKMLKQIRQDFNLKKDDGFDDNRFFTSEEIYLDETIITYKRIIYKLSLT